jgi:K+ transporter
VIDDLAAITGAQAAGGPSDVAVARALQVLVGFSHVQLRSALATAATIIASQSIISGAFSVTQQAVRLGYAPRLRILHTSGASVGQIYVPLVNAILFVAVVGLVIGFGSSSRLAAAFGLAVTATMVLTTLMIGFVIFRIWHWNRLWAIPLYGTLLLFDLATGRNVGEWPAHASRGRSGLPRAPI